MSSKLSLGVSESSEELVDEINHLDNLCQQKRNVDPEKEQIQI
jgi:hypothetical protein